MDKRENISATRCTPVRDRANSMSINGPGCQCLISVSWSTKDSRAASGASHSAKVARRAESGTNEPDARYAGSRERTFDSVVITKDSYSSLRICDRAAHKAQIYREEPEDFDSS